MFLTWSSLLGLYFSAGCFETDSGQGEQQHFAAAQLHQQTFDAADK